MPELKNARWERFATIVATGEFSIAKAYAAAGYTAKNENVANSAGQKLVRVATVRSRVDELKAEIATAVQQRAKQIVQKIEDAAQALPAVVLARNLTERTERVKLLAEYADKIEKAFAARAQDERNQDIPGIETGVVAVTYKLSKDNVEREYSIDTGSIRELRAVNQQIAQELGQWVDKTQSDVHVKDALERASAAELDELLAKLEEKRAQAKQGEQVN